MTYEAVFIPRITCPLYVGGQAVTISGHAAGAHVYVRSRSNSRDRGRIIGDRRRAPDVQEFNIVLNQPLGSGERLSAYQEIDGVHSEELPWALAKAVEAPPTPGTPTIWCGRTDLRLNQGEQAFRVGNIVHGARVEIEFMPVGTSSWIPFRDSYYAWSSIGFTLIDPLVEGDQIRARQQLGNMDQTSWGYAEAVGCPDEQLATPTIREPLYQCQPSFQVEGTEPGATLHIYVQGERNPIISQVATSTITHVAYPEGLRAGWSLYAVQELNQELCPGHQSRESDVARVLPLDQLPPPTILPYERESRSILVQGVYQAEIQIYAEGRPIGGGKCYGTTLFEVGEYIDEIAETVIPVQSLACESGEGRGEGRPVDTIDLVVGQPLDIEEINELLARHNWWRDQVGVPHLTWSDTLTIEAQACANSLAIRDVLEHCGSSGENAYMSTSTTRPRDVVDAWCEKERDNYVMAGEREILATDTSLPPEEQILHYTQVVWSGTERLGGGRATARSGREYWVCTYDPPGNVINHRPYTP